MAAVRLGRPGGPLPAGPVSEAAKTTLRGFVERYRSPAASIDYAPIFQLGQEEHFAPKTFLGRAGEPCERVHLVLSGVARHCCAYGGQYHTVDFSLPQELLTDAAGFWGRKPAQLDLVAVTPLHTVSFTYEQIVGLYAANPQWEQCGRRVAEAHGRRLARRALSLQLKPAAARYAELMQTRAHLFNQVPLNQLASYLGMAKETLSRLRRGGPGG